MAALKTSGSLARNRAQAALDKAEAGAYKPQSAASRGAPAAQVAQLVEHATENRSVGGSIPPLGTIKIKDLARIVTVQ